MTPYPTGTYSAKVESYTIGESATGTPFIGLMWVLQDGEKLEQHLWMSPKAAQNSMDKLSRHLEFDQGLFSAGKTDEERANNAESALSAMVGLRCDIEVKHESYNGRTQVRVEFPASAKTFQGSEKTAALARLAKIGTRATTTSTDREAF